MKRLSLSSHRKMASMYGTMGMDETLASSTSSINSLGSMPSSLNISGPASVTTTPDASSSQINSRKQPSSVNTFGSVNPDITSEVDLNTTSETDADDRKNYQPNILERALERTICYHPRHRSKPSKLTVSLLSVFVILCTAAILIILPIYASSMDNAGSDVGVMTLIIAGVVPVFIVPLTLVLRHFYDKTITMRPTASLSVYVVMGVCYALGLNMLMFSSHPSRTPLVLQPPMSSSAVVFTVLAYLLIKRKAVSCRRLACVLVLYVAVFIACEPIIWELQGSRDLDLFTSGDLLHDLAWPAIYACAFLPIACYYVIADKELKKNKVHPFSLATSALLSGVVFSLLMFGTDFIPWYGNVKTFPEYWDNIQIGFRCNFTYTTACKHTLIKLIILGASLLCLNAFCFILIFATEGAVFTAMVCALGIPVAQGFWSLFDYDYHDDVFSWDPQWTYTTAFTLGGVALAVPSVAVYNVFSHKDARKVKRETKGYSDVSSSEYE